MKVLGIRFCSVSPQAEQLASFLDGLGLPRQPKAECAPDPAGPFPGVTFPAGGSWIEIWQQGEEMPAGTMLQVVLDDVDAFASQATVNGLAPEGPMDAGGERIYFLHARGGLDVSFQSRLPTAGA